MKLPHVLEKCRGVAPLLSSQRKRCPRSHHEERDPRFARSQVGPSAEPAVFVRNGYRAAICDGAAHTNAHIDYCARCAPMWGVMAVKVNP